MTKRTVFPHSSAPG